MQALKRVIALVFLGLGLLVPVTSSAQENTPPRPLASAFEAMQEGRWSRAAELAKRAGPVAEEIVEWMRLRAGKGRPDEVLAFLESNGHWPGLNRLREKSEPAFQTATDAQVLTFFDGYEPTTGMAALRLADAQFAAGQQGEAEVGLVLAWRTLELSTAEHDLFVTEHGELLAPHHAARHDMTLWRGLKDAVLMESLVSEDRRKLAAARRAAQQGLSGLDARIAILPEAMRADPGLAFDRFERLLKRDDDELAIALIIDQSRSEAGLGEPARWASQRRTLARRMMRAEAYQTAYELASLHGLDGGGAYADLEWLSGYLALRFLDEPELALDHFQRLRAAVRTPISLGRAGYWIGRAQEALGDVEAAQVAYAEGAQHVTSFYGILAVEKAGITLPEELAGGEVFPDWREAGFAESDLFKAMELVKAAGQEWLAEMFVTQMADTLDRQGLGQLGAALADLGDSHLQVMAGKRAARRGLVLVAPYYALHPMTELDLPIDMEMALAIARRESEFDFSVKSGAGAEGLMQVMPATARDVARDTGLPMTPSEMRSDWKMNARIGAAYLAQMTESWDGNIVLVSISYNAGPQRAERWIERYGDPREPLPDGWDIVDWIEHIPFRETRNYVQRVAESLPIYRARLGEDPLLVPFTAELVGRSLTSGLAKTE